MFYLPLKKETVIKMTVTNGPEVKNMLLLNCEALDKSIIFFTFQHPVASMIQTIQLLLSNFKSQNLAIFLLYTKYINKILTDFEYCLPVTDLRLPVTDLSRTLAQEICLMLRAGLACDSLG